MNVNEVIANRAIQILGGKIGDKSVHPNDDVISVSLLTMYFQQRCIFVQSMDYTVIFLSSMEQLEAGLKDKVKKFSEVVKVGRTHLMDAVPLTLGQEFSGYVQQLCVGRERIHSVLDRLYFVALGGTAVGTGVNASADFCTSLRLNGLQRKVVILFSQRKIYLRLVLRTMI